MVPVSSNPIKARLCQSSKDFDLEGFWECIIKDARAMASAENELESLLVDVILSQDSFAHALAARLARKLARADMPQAHLVPLLTDIFVNNEELVKSAANDSDAVVERDPACDSRLQPLMFFKGFQALATYRISNHLWYSGRKPLALYFQSICNEVFGVDIHPAARIGCGILLDHATSFVVGETAIIEDHVSILHEVTLGGTGKQSGDRHPIIRTGVMIGAGSKILGRVEIGEYSKVGAGSVVLHNVEPHTTVAGVPAVEVGRSAENDPASEMNQSLYCGGDGI